MRKLFKAALWAALAAAVLTLSAFLVLRFYFTPERVRSLITEYAGKNLSREITLDAAILGLRGFSVKNLRIAEAGGFGKGQFFAAEEFSVRPDLRALLNKEFKISSVYASGVVLSIRQLDKTAYNFSDLMPAEAAAPEKPAAEGERGPVELNISRINLKKARISYISADGSMTVTLSNLNLKADSLTPDGLFPYEAAFSLEIRSPYLNGTFPAQARGRAALGGWDPSKGRAEIEKASVKAGKISCELEGSLANLVEPDAALRLRVKSFSSSDLQPYFKSVPPRILLPALEADAAFKLDSSGMLFKKLEFKAGPASGSLKGRLSWDPVFDYDLTADIKGSTPEMDSTEIARKFRAVPVGIKLPQAEIRAAFSATPEKIKLRSSGISAGKLKLSTEGDFLLRPAFAARGRLKASAADLRELGAVFRPLKEYELKGSVSGDIDFSFARSFDLRGKAEFSGVGASAAGLLVSDMGGKAEFSRSSLKAVAAGKLDGAPLKLDLSARNLAAHPQVVLNADLASFKPPSLPEARPQEKAGKTDASKKRKASGAGAGFAFDISGRTRLESITHPNLTAGETVLTYDLKNVSPDPAALSGSAAFTVDGGKFENLYELAKKNKAAKIALYPVLTLGKASRLAKSLKLPDFNTIVFTKMEGDYLFQGGTMKIQRSSLMAAVADADTAGSIDLVSDTLDLKIKTRLKPASGINLSEPVAMTVKGSFDDPSVKPDVKSLMAQPAVKESVQKLLKKFLK